MANANGDRNLLFGILALQMDFIRRDALIRAMHAWVLDKDKPLGQILVEQQALGSEPRALLDAVVEQHLRQHGDDAEKSLGSVRSLSSLREELKRIADPDVQASLAHVPPAGDPGTTGPYSPHAAGSDSVGAPSEVGRRFRVLRPHAEGGLGKVSVARDEELHREVALKEIKEHHADHPESRARFLVEAEITGGLEHPGIVPVYGLGAYADGRPFYAMRFIKGDSLKDAIQHFHETKGPLNGGPRALELRQLLGRFNDVCDAIGYAHSRGVLHRDLKPGNVMLGKYGETLVVDWGLAKPVGRPDETHDGEEPTLRPASAGDAAPTQYGQAIGTPAYMSPEQAAGKLDELGPATDVYSLGATLYCLLTGRAPFERGDLGVMLPRVQRGDFPRPRQVRRDVPRALEAVCLKAMALRPQDRYATPRDLAADVEKWLADEPTTAYREPWRVRAWRWVKRHRTAVSATAAAAVAVLALGSVLLWSFLSQRWELVRQTTAELDSVRDLRDQGRFGEARSAMARAEHLLTLGDPAGVAGRARQARKDLEMAAELDEAPLLASRSTRKGGYEKEAVVRRYRELFRGYGIDPAVPDPAEAASRIRASDLREQLVVALDFWASWLPPRDVEWARLVETAGRADGDQVRRGLRAAWAQADGQALQRQLEGRDLSSLQPTTSAAIAEVFMQQGSVSRAEQVLRAVQQVHPNDFYVNHVLYEVLDESPAHRDEALGFLRTAVAVKPDSPGVHNNLGTLLAEVGRREEAEAEYRRAIRIQDDNALAHNNLGLLLNGSGRRKEAEAEYRRAIRIEDDLALAHNNLGVLLYYTDRREEAEAEYRRAIQIQDDYAEAHNNLGNLLDDAGRRDEAEAEYRRAIQIQDDLALAHYNLGLLLAKDAGRPEEAEKEYHRAIQIKDDYAEAHNNLGALLGGLGRQEEAEREVRRALQIKDDLAEAHVSLGQLLARAPSGGGGEGVPTRHPDQGKIRRRPLWPRHPAG